jgi:diguanylate cyclase (GGDEF)-like protein/PAS domain S-box-containing protein
MNASPSPTVPAPARVLAVDDDGAMVVLLRRVVERMGHKCETVESGEAAVALLAEDTFDLIITDVNMAGLSGLDLLESAGRCDPDLASIVVSGVDDPGTAEAALEGGAFGYVVKPFELLELQIAVSNALRRRELEIELRTHLQHLEAEVERRAEQLVQATHEVQTQERRFRSLAQASPIGILYADEGGSVDYCNRKAETLLGRQTDELIDYCWLDILDTPSTNLLELAVAEAVAGASDAICEYELRRPDGSAVRLQSRIAPVLDDDDDTTGVVVLFEDVGDRARMERELRHQASHDHLTNLPNRREFRAQLVARVASLGRDETMGVLLVDLDQFKLVNDTYGHEAGDELIVTVANRLMESVPPGSLVARLGGDEYVVAIVGHGRQSVLDAAEEVRRALRRPIPVMGVELSLSVSIGIGIASDPQTPVSGLLRSADIAMHHAKIRRDVVEVFDMSMAADVARRLELTSELRRAVDDQVLTAHYQPVFDTASGQLVGFEALARWTHSEWGPVGPDEFIPIAESIGLVQEIDRQILTAAIRQLSEWRATGRVRSNVSMSVNLSPSQLANSKLPELVHDTLRRYGLPGSSLSVEVTETTLIGDLNRAVPILERLQKLGVTIAIDDFGTGHSALAYLSQLPLDVLKIDRSFINEIGHGAVDLAEIIIDLAHRFDLAVVAEGVEEPHQLARLRELNCDMVQGFLTGRPEKAELAVPVADQDVAPKPARRDTVTQRASDLILNEVST